MTKRRSEPPGEGEAVHRRHGRRGPGRQGLARLGVLAAAGLLLTSAPAEAEPSAEPAADGALEEGAAEGSRAKIRLQPKKGPRSVEPRSAADTEPGEPAKAKPTTTKPKPKAKPSKPKRPPKLGKREAQGIAAAIGVVDQAKLPRLGDPSVLPGYDDRFAGITGVPGAATGWSGSIAEPAFVDRRRRYPLVPRPEPFGDTLRPGERFRYDVTFSGNPTGIAEAQVLAREPGPFGSPDQVHLEGFARTSGVVSLLTTLTYKIKSTVDAFSGAPLTTYAETKRTGFGRDRYREVNTTFGGRGHVFIHDKRVSDKKSEVKIRERLPVDTLDSLAVMAWVRALDLKAGEKARVYGLDGKVLLRVDITGKGPSKLDPMPGIATALGLGKDDLYELAGTITRVDRFGAPIPGKKVYKLRVWLSDDGRRIPVALESDVWLGVVRLNLTQYDPPSGDGAPLSGDGRAGATASSSSAP